MSTDESYLGKIVKNGFKIIKSGNKSKVNNSKQVRLSKSAHKYHVHFGAGNLGIGLVVRKFLVRKLIIIQRASTAWDILSDCNSIKLFSNNVEYLQLHFLHQDSINFSDHFNKIFLSGESLFVCVNDNNVINHILQHAESISTSLGNPGLLDIKDTLENIKKNKGPLNFYPFENDYSFVNTIKSKCLNIIPVIADKICFDRQIEGDELRISAEDFETIYLLSNNSKVKQEISPERVQIISDSAVYNFYRNRKLYLVNGLHMVAALFGYGFLSERKVPINDWSSRYLTEVMGNSNIVLDLKTFISIQAIRIILSSSKETLNKIYNTSSFDVIYNKLYTYGEEILKLRFNFSLDHLGRLLKIDRSSLPQLGNKLDERVGAMIDFINDNKTEINSLLPKINSMPMSREDLLASVVKLQKNIATLWKEINRNLLQT